MCVCVCVLGEEVMVCAYTIVKVINGRVELYRSEKSGMPMRSSLFFFFLLFVSTWREGGGGGGAIRKTHYLFFFRVNVSGILSWSPLSSQPLTIYQLLGFSFASGGLSPMDDCLPFPCGE